jgi:hypothetical protein
MSTPAALSTRVESGAPVASGPNQVTLPGWAPVDLNGTTVYNPLPGTTAPGANPTYQSLPNGTIEFNGNSLAGNEGVNAPTLAAAEQLWSQQWGTPLPAATTTRQTEPVARENPPAASGSATTTGTGSASQVDPLLGQLAQQIEGSGGTAYGQSTGTSLPPSTVLPVDTSGGVSSGSGLSTSEVIAAGVVASLIAAAIWYFVIKHKSLKDLEHVF